MFDDSREVIELRRVVGESSRKDLEDPLPVKTTRETVCYFRPERRPVPSVVSFHHDRLKHDMYSLHDPTYEPEKSSTLPVGNAAQLFCMVRRIWSRIFVVGVRPWALRKK